ARVFDKENTLTRHETPASSLRGQRELCLKRVAQRRMVGKWTGAAIQPAYIQLKRRSERSRLIGIAVFLWVKERDRLLEPLGQALGERPGVRRIGQDDEAVRLKMPGEIFFTLMLAQRVVDHQRHGAQYVVRRQKAVPLAERRQSFDRDLHRAPRAACVEQRDHPLLDYAAFRQVRNRVDLRGVRGAT